MAVTVTILNQACEKKISCEPEQSLLDAMVAGGIYVSAPCGGKGRCGKCTVQMVNGACAPSPEDREHFDERELGEGFRLACRAFPEQDCEVRVLGSTEKEFDVLSEVAVKHTETETPDSGIGDADHTPAAYFFAIDIGTTTLAISLVAESKEVRDTYTAVNHQRAYGADVISRIRAYDEGKGAEMTASVKKDLLGGMQSLLLNNSVDGTQITDVVIAGNTTMGHLLLGYDCHGLGQMPFTPVNIETVRIGFPELFESDLLTAPVTVMPGFSAYVGGDIVSGLLCCKFYENEKPSLFIDLGTNGEMAIGCKGRLLVTSTAAGPAFEGGNISCGMGSVSGAICGVTIDGGRTALRTIGEQPATGICGTGVIEMTAELLKEELLDETGLLDEDYFDDGYPLATLTDGSEIVFTQKDIRELQLAKAAVRGGLETLLVRYGIHYDDLEKVYVAGGFGVHLNMAKAVAIGLLPEEVLDKIEAVGNTALGGAICYETEEHAEEYCRQMIACATEVDLSTDKNFQEFYMDGMMFE